MHIARATAVLASFLALAAAGCTSGGVGITEKDFAIDPSTSEASAGDVTFNIHNDGPSVHEFVVIKTDLDEANLPLTADGSEVDEDKLNGVGEKEDIQPNTDATLTLNLPAGNYVLICNISRHYTQGMHASFKVT